MWRISVMGRQFLPHWQQRATKPSTHLSKSARRRSQSDLYFASYASHSRRPEVGGLMLAALSPSQRGKLCYLLFWGWTTRLFSSFTLLLQVIRIRKTNT